MLAGEAVTGQIKDLSPARWDEVDRLCLDWLEVGTRQPLKASLRTSLGDLVRTSLGIALDEGFCGQQDGHWVGIYDVPRRLGIVAYEEQADAGLDLWVKLTRSCGWLWPYEGVCTICEGPQLVRTEGPYAPALKFGDGWTAYGAPLPSSWRGSDVPASRS